MVKRKRANDDLQNITQKTKDRAIRTLQKKLGVNSGALEGKAVPVSHIATHHNLAEQPNPTNISTRS